LGLASRGDGVRFGVSVAQNFQELDQIGLLLRVELEIADLTIGLGRRSCLGGRDSGNVLDVVKDLGWREEWGVAGRRTLAEVESDLLAIGVNRDVPLIVEVDDILEALEDAVVHVRLHEIWRRPLVRAAHARRLEEAAKLGDVARNILVEPRPIRSRIGIGTHTVIDVPGPEWIIPVGIGFLVGLLVVGVVDVLRDADVRITVHGERIFSLRDRLYRGYCHRGVTLKALGLAEIQLPPAFLGRGERVRVLRRRTILGGVVFRTERADLSRGLVCSECLTKEFVDLLRSVHLEGILAEPHRSPTPTTAPQRPSRAAQIIRRFLMGAGPYRLIAPVFRSRKDYVKKALQQL